MEYICQNIASDYMQQLESKKIAVDCRISELAYENVSKILCLDASGKIDSYDPNDGEVKVKGKINYKLVYEDGEKLVKSLNYLADFEDIIKDENLLSTDKIMAFCKVQNVSSSGLDIIRLSATINVEIYRVNTKEIPVVLSEDKSCYCKSENVKKSSYVTSINSAFDISDEIEQNEKISEVLMLNNSCVLDNATCLENQINLVGKCYLEITYLTDSGIYKKELNLPFNEEIECASSADCSCYAFVDIENAKVVLSSDDLAVKIKLLASVKAMVFKSEEVPVVSDMYSMQQKLDIVKNDGYFVTYNGYKNFSKRVSIEAVLKEDLGGDIISTICPKNSIASIKNNDEFLSIDGVFSACLLYKNNDEISSINIEAPYSIESDENYQKNVASAGIKSVACRLKTDNTLSLDIELEFTLICQSENTTCVVGEVKEMGELDICKSAISIIVIDRPQNFFDVAKNLATTPEELEKQNPSLCEPLTVGDKLYYYRKLECNAE